MPPLKFRTRTRSKPWPAGGRQSFLGRKSADAFDQILVSVAVAGHARANFRQDIEGKTLIKLG